MTDFNVWAAVRTLRGHLGLANGKQMAMLKNPHLTDEEWADAIARARQVIASRQSELTRNLSARPIASEILPFHVNSPGGYIQQVEVFVKDNDTGVVETRSFSYKTDTLRRRLDVTKEVWNMFLQGIADNPSEYPETVVGVAYVGTHELLPKP
jgi:hypothetical protein